MLPGDFQILKEYHDKRKTGKAQTFIVKPEASCQGRGIYLTRNIESIYFLI
jgi:tubulin polyglutamylase TTLL6/13